MDLSQPILGLADASIERPPFKVTLTRIPFDDYFTLHMVKEGRAISEELEAEPTRQWFKDHGVTNKDALDKALDECWNFYHTVIYIPADIYKEPVLPFPQFQPQV